jgi:hypothetical protein
MPFQPNDERINRDGRPKERHVTNKELKMLFKGMLYDNTNYLIERLSDLTIRDRIALQKILASHVLPRLNSVAMYGDDFSPFQQIQITDDKPKHL